MVDTDVISPISDSKLENVFVLHSFPVSKPDGSVRPIVDWRPLNQLLRCDHFQMESIRTVFMLIQPSDFLVKMDLEKAYWHIRLAKNSTNFGAVWFRDSVWSFNCMAFGLNIAPRLFTKHLQPVIAHLRDSHRFRMVVYLDDIMQFHQDPCELSTNARTTFQLLENLGWKLSLKKCHLEPSQKLIILGFEINTIDMMARIPSDKLRALKSELNITLERAQRDELTLRQLARTVGVLRSNSHAVSNIGAKLLESQDLLRRECRKHTSWDSLIVIPREVKGELSRWLDCVGFWNGRSFARFHAEIIITTDASPLGWGASVLSPTVPSPSAKGVWSQGERLLHINELEILAVLNGLKAHVSANGWSNVSILLGIDNCCALAYLLKSSGRILHLARLIRELVFWAEDRGLRLHGEYIASEDNVEADSLSRSVTDFTDWRLDTRVFVQVCQIFGTPKIDLFASAANKLLSVFVSYKPQPGALFVDALSPFCCWRDFELSFINPPFAIISQVLQKLIEDRACAIFILPVWPAAHWWPLFLDLLVDYPRLLPDWALQFQRTPDASVTYPSWASLCCKLSGHSSSVGASARVSQIMSTRFSNRALWPSMQVYGVDGGATQ